MSRDYLYMHVFFFKLGGYKKKEVEGNEGQCVRGELGRQSRGGRVCFPFMTRVSAPSGMLLILI